MHDTDVDSKPQPLLRDKHAKFFLRFLNLLPARLASHDSHRATIIFFAVCGLDVLNSLHLLKDPNRKGIIEWIYGCQVNPNEGNNKCCGFLGSRLLKIKCDDPKWLANLKLYQCGHLAMTYTSIATLITLGDDLRRLNRKAIVDGVAACQRSDGSFEASVEGNEHDMRFVYCAAAICYMLDYWGDVNKDLMFQYILNSIRYDFGVSQHLEAESHGGTTFCAIAALELSGQLNRLSHDTIENMKRWLVFRQVDGFHGRPNKPVDTCYSFWIGSSLEILGAFHLTDYAMNRSFVMDTQDNVVGGFGKWPSSTTDPFHTYFGLCGLSFIEEPGLCKIMPSLNITMSSYNRLLQLHEIWRTEVVENQMESKNQDVSENAPLIVA